MLPGLWQLESKSLLPSDMGPCSEHLRVSGPRSEIPQREKQSQQHRRFEDVCRNLGMGEPLGQCRETREGAETRES